MDTRTDDDVLKDVGVVVRGGCHGGTRNKENRVTSGKSVHELSRLCPGKVYTRATQAVCPGKVYTQVIQAVCPVKIRKTNHSDSQHNVGHNSRKKCIPQINQIHKFSWMNTASTLSCIIHRNRTYIKTIPIFHFRKYQIRNATLENFDQGNLYKFKFKQYHYK